MPLSHHHDLVGDIGGTHARLALACGGVLLRETLRTMRADDFAGPEALLRAYLQGQGQSGCAAVCLGVAGPVHGDTVRMTNRPWRIAADTLATRIGAQRVTLLNDVQALGHALDTLAPDAARPLIGTGRPVPGTSRLAITLGTGVNAVPVHQANGVPFVPPAEVGHTSLPAPTPETAALARFLGGAATVEQALSGAGLMQMDRWSARDTAGAMPSARHPEQIVAALDQGEPRARAAIALYSTILGELMRDLALTHLPRGGIFLAGGLARALAPALARAKVDAPLRTGGDGGAELADIPVYVVLDDAAALAGCAARLAGEAGLPRPVL